MNWYNFYGFIKLPIGIAFGIIDLIIILSMMSQNILMGLISIFIDIVQIGYMIFLINVMSNKPKDGFSYIFAWLIVETLVMGIKTTLQSPSPITQTFIISTLIATIIWFLPNYVYFNKRRKIFE